MLVDLNDAKSLSENSPDTRGWDAQLELGFELRNDKTVLAHRRHQGPLTVQRPFYPEGGVCHVYLLHPPGGVVAGDSLTITITAAVNSAALITTPAAGKFYRSSGPLAQQTVNLKVEDGAILEWLPQETIIYEGARVACKLSVNLEKGARFIGWEVIALGRPAANEGFTVGELSMSWQIFQGGELFYQERLCLDAKAFAARWGLNGHSACGTLFVFPATLTQLEKVQQLIGEATGLGVTLIDELLICRALDTRADRLRSFFQQVWAMLRPDVLQCKACEPRIWAT
jgi:urease accessory protein